MVFKRLFQKKKSYAEKKRELEVADEIYSGMQSLSDNQLDKWIETRIKLENLRRSSNEAMSVVSIKRATHDH